MSNSRRVDKHPKPKRTWLKVSLVVVLVLLVGVGTYFFSIYNHVNKTVNQQMHKPLPSIDHHISKEKMEEKEPLNILLLGVDKRPGDKGRSDSIIVMNLDPANNKMQLISIPRDTRTEIVGKGFTDKINHAYAYGGPDMSIETVENLLDIELDYYVQMNMEGLIDLVDAVGGITVNNELDWYDSSRNFHYAKGELNLDGRLTMGFVRMRYQDSRGDFGRTERQRKVIKGLIKKGASIGTVHKIDDIMDVLGKNMTTNMDFAIMRDLLLHYKDVRKNVVSYMLKGSGTRIDGTYYLIVPDEEIQKVNGMIE
nr:LCP family protein [Oceanobacillus senegalensis]